MDYDILHLSTKTEKMDETAIPMGKMLNAFLAIHGRCKFIIFLRGQTPSLSAPTLILSLMEHFQGKAKKHCKTQYKINIFHIHTIKLQLTSGEPPASALYIYIYVCVCVYTLYHWIGSLRLMANMFGKKTHPVILQSQGAGQWTLRRSDVNLAQMQK